jgi:tetratricopeptide (TPR) repeat protein
VVCGSRLDLPENLRRERYLFFVTPFLLIIAGIALGIELNLSGAIEAGMGLGGAMALVYLGAGAIFWAISKMFRMATAPESYWQAGILTLLQLIACMYLVYYLEIICFGPVLTDVGPLQYQKSRLAVLAAIYLPTLLSLILAVAARARFKMRRSERLKPWQSGIFKNACLIIPAATFSLGLMISLLQPAEISSLVKARMLMDIGSPGNALKIADAALEKKEDFGPLHFVKGSAILDAQNENHSPAEALYHLNRALVLVPENPIYLYRASVAHDIESNYELALETASRAASLQGDDSFLWQHLGELNLKYQRYEEAVKVYSRALELDPENALLLNNFAYTCLETGKNEAEALEMAKKSVELLPGFIFNTDTLAWAFYKNGYFAEALDTINVLYDGNNQHSAEVDFHYAMILYENDLLAKPVEAMEKLLARPEAVADKKLYHQIGEAKDRILSDIKKDVQAEVANEID